MDKPDGQIDMDPALSTARVSVPGTANLPHWYPFQPVWDDSDGYGPDDGQVDAGSDDPARQSLPTVGLDGNSNMSFESVAPPHMGPESRAHVGDGGSGHGGYVLGTDRPD